MMQHISTYPAHEWAIKHGHNGYITEINGKGWLSRGLNYCITSGKLNQARKFNPPPRILSERLAER